MASSCSPSVGAPTACTHVRVPADAKTLPLIIGVMSYNSSQALARREGLRALFNASTSSLATVRFVLGALDADSSREDVLTLRVPSNGRRMGAFMLTLAFFKHAVRLPFEFIARADDDADFDPDAIAVTLGWLERQGLPNIVYGPRDMAGTAMWDRVAMKPMCFARAVRPTTGICAREDVVGPFPFAKGPLVAYSRALLGELLPHYERDAEHAANYVDALGRRGLPSGRGRILFDDIYLAAVMYMSQGNASISLVNAPMSEWVPARARMAPPRPLRTAAVLHMLKSADRFEFVRAQSGALLRNRTWRMELRCRTVKRPGCCRRWQKCGWKGWKDCNDRADGKVRPQC